MSDCPFCAEPHQQVDVYPVGVLSNISRAYRYLTARTFPGATSVTWKWRVSRAATEIYAAWRSIRRYVKQRNWRELRSHLNGYLAEPRHWPDGLSRCGSGWTRHRAMRSLRHLTAREATPTPEADTVITALQTMEATRGT